MPHIEIAAEKITSFLGLPITNALLMSWLVVFLLIVFSLMLSKKISLVPDALQNIWEVLIEGVLGLMTNIFGSREEAEKYLPMVATIFLFVLTSNWLGIFPGVGSVGFFEKIKGNDSFIPMFRSAASDLNFTLALAVLTVILINIKGASALGFSKHTNKYFNFKNPINFSLGLLEFVSEFAKIISFSFRLFGNVFAGEVLLIIIAFLVPIAVPVPFLIMEVFVGFVQALVFSMLSMVFISIAVAHH